MLSHSFVLHPQGIFLSQLFKAGAIFAFYGAFYQHVIVFSNREMIPHIRSRFFLLRFDIKEQRKPVKEN